MLIWSLSLFTEKKQWELTQSFLNKSIYQDYLLFLSFMQKWKYWWQFIKQDLARLCSLLICTQKNNFECGILKIRFLRIKVFSGWRSRKKIRVCRTWNFSRVWNGFIKSKIRVQMKRPRNCHNVVPAERHPTITTQCCKNFLKIAW